VAVGHYENFPVASRLVPAQYRAAVVAVYRFARAADDIADEGDAQASARLAALAQFDDQLSAIASGATPSAPPFPALAAAVRRHALSIVLLRDLLSAFAQDVTTTRYPTYAALADYARRSANPVGRLVLQIYGLDNDLNARASDSICTGLQLANFWQDIAIDWQKGRIYVPLEDLTRFGVTEAHIADANCDERWRGLVAFETARTRALLEAGRPLVRALPWRLALELSATIAGGLRILERIDAVQGDVFRRRPQLRMRDWALVAARAFRPAREPHLQRHDA
jgi:squalene synthase HpnC